MLCICKQQKPLSAQSNEYSQLCQHMTKPTKWPVCPAKTQISQGSAQSDQSLCCASMGSEGPKVSSFRQRRLNRLGRSPG